MLERARCTQSPSPLPLPFPSPSMGSLLSAAEAADAAAAATAAAARATAVPVAAAAATAAACHYYGPGVVAAAGPGVVTLRCLAPTSLPPSLYRPSCPANGPHPAMRTRRRRAPTGPAAGSPGLDKAAPGVADIKHSSLRKAMQRRPGGTPLPAGPAETGAKLQQDKWQEISG